MKLQEQITKKQMTSKEFAKKLNVDEPTVSRFVNYKCLPIPSTMKNICELLECKVDDIYSEQEISFKECKRKRQENEYSSYKVTVNLPREAKEFLHKALKSCGYKDITYWIYRCYERLQAQYKIIEKAEKKKAIRTTEQPLVRRYRLIRKSNNNSISNGI